MTRNQSHPPANTTPKPPPTTPRPQIDTVNKGLGSKKRSMTEASRPHIAQLMFRLWHEARGHTT